MTIPPTIILLLVAVAAIVLGVLIYLINAIAVRRAYWAMREADETVIEERENRRRFVDEVEERLRLKPQHS